MIFNSEWLYAILSSGYSPKWVNQADEETQQQVEEQPGPEPLFNSYLHHSQSIHWNMLPARSFKLVLNSHNALILHHHSKISNSKTPWSPANKNLGAFQRNAPFLGSLFVAPVEQVLGNRQYSLPKQVISKLANPTSTYTWRSRSTCLRLPLTEHLAAINKDALEHRFWAENTSGGIPVLGNNLQGLPAFYISEGFSREPFKEATIEQNLHIPCYKVG